MPDVPRVMASLGASWQMLPGWTLSPRVHYTGKRYADSAHAEKVGSYTRVDLDLANRTHTAWGELTTRLGVINLFDRKYIGLVTASDVQGTDSFSYYPGAPLTLMGSVALTF